MKYWILISQRQEPISGITLFPLDLMIFRVNQDTYELQSRPEHIYAKVQESVAFNNNELVLKAHSHLFDIEVPDEEAVPTAKQLAREWLQLQAFSTDLADLKQRAKSLSVGWLPWTVIKAQRIRSKINITLAEIKGMVQQFGIEDTQVMKQVPSVQQLLDETEMEMKRRQGEIESRSNFLGFMYFLLGVLLTVALFLISGVPG